MTKWEEAIQTVETTARLLRGLTALSRRVGGPRAEVACTTAARLRARRLTYLRDLSARARQRAVPGRQMTSLGWDERDAVVAATPRLSSTGM